MSELEAKIASVIGVAERSRCGEFHCEVNI